MVKHLAIFDLDSTLVDGDSELILVEYMIRKGLIGKEFLPQIEQYCIDYENGTLDYAEYERYLMTPFKSISAEKLSEYLHEYLGVLQPYFRPYMLERVREHQDQGHELMLATASNHLLAEIVAEYLHIPNLICTRMEMKDGLPTGEIAQAAPFREGKVRAIEVYAQKLGADLQESWGYSDSHNDIPFLSAVGHPVAVTPDERLRAQARSLNWPIIEKPA
jgi:HAD superfamily hydrolase (TIGR01490 family)